MTDTQQPEQQPKPERPEELNVIAAAYDHAARLLQEKAKLEAALATAIADRDAYKAQVEILTNDNGILNQRIKNVTAERDVFHRAYDDLDGRVNRIRDSLNMASAQTKFRVFGEAPPDGTTLPDPPSDEVVEVDPVPRFLTGRPRRPGAAPPLPGSRPKRTFDITAGLAKALGTGK